MPNNPKKGLWREHLEELDNFILEIEKGRIKNSKRLLNGLNKIFGSEPKVLGVNYNVIRLLEYSFYRAGNPYSPSFDRYSSILTKIMIIYPQIRGLLNDTSENAIGNMVLGGVGALKFQIVDYYELCRVLDVWESMGLRRVTLRNVLRAIMSKKDFQNRIQANDVLLLARLNEIFPMFKEEFIPNNIDLDLAIYEYQKQSYEPIISSYGDKGYSLQQMIVLESKRKKPVGLKRNNLLSYLIKKKHNFQCQLCKTLHENIHGDVEIHHIISLEYGGDDRSDNMIVLCKKHHKDVHEGLIRINALDKICINYLGKNYSLLYN